MSKGTKNYFRHSFFAHENRKIVDLVSKHGKEAYYHYFVLIELCAAQYVARENKKTSFKFHKRTVCDKLLVTPQRLGGHLLAIQSSLGGHWVVSDCTVEIEYPKIAEYLGSYNSYSPNKIKENKIKYNTTSEVPTQTFGEKENKLVNELCLQLKNNNPTIKLPTSKTAWLKEADKILRIDKRPFDEAMKILKFSQTDNFWKQNILSMGKFRDKYDQLKIKEATNGQGNNRPAAKVKHGFRPSETDWANQPTSF